MLDEVVDLVLPHLPPGIVGARSASRIRAAVGEVPSELVGRVAFECPLYTDAADADVLFSADSDTGGMEKLAGRHPFVRLPQEFANAATWAPVIRFCVRREPGFLLHCATRDVWIDLAQRDAPSFAFGLRLAGLRETPGPPLEVLVRAIDMGLGALRGAPLEPPAATTMRAVLRRLPETARVDSAGLLAGPPDEVRLWLARLTPEQILDFIKITRDRSEARAVRDVLGDVAPPPGSVGARIDVYEGVGRGIALIHAVDQVGSPAQVADRWRPLLDALVLAGLCTLDKHDALLGCYGALRERESGRWPEHLTRLSELFGDGAESVLRWHVNHITVECDRGEPIGATGQIVVRHIWSRP